MIDRLVEWVVRPLRGGESVIQQGAGQGLHFDAAGAKAGYVIGSAEPAMQAALVRLLRPGMTFFDVGAHVGFLTVIGARLVGPEGRVVGFEPVRASADQARKNAAANGYTNVEIRTVALGNTDGEARFAIFADSSLATMRALEHTAPQHADTHLPICRLDALMDEGSLPLPDVIKIDVEGVEVEMLAGAHRTLSDARPMLLIELHSTNNPIADMLERLRYRVAVLAETTRIREASAQAQVVAVPEEHPEVDALIAHLTRPDLQVPRT